MAVGASFPIAGYGSTGIAVDPQVGLLFVADGQKVGALHEATGIAIGYTTLAGSPTGLAYDPSNGNLIAGLVTTTGDGEVAIMNASTQTLVTYVAAGSSVFNGNVSVAIDPTLDEGYVSYVQSGGGFEAFNASTGAVIRVVSFGVLTGGLAADPLRNVLYESDQSIDNVTVFNASALTDLGTFHVGASATGIAVDVATGEAIVTNTGANNVTLVRGPPYHAAGWVTTGTVVSGIAEDPAARIVAVAQSTSSVLTEFNASTETVGRTAPSPYNPEQLVWNGHSQRFYSAEFGGAVSSYYGTNGSLDGTATVDTQVTTLAVDNGYGQLFAAGPGSYFGYYGPVLSVFNLGTLALLNQYNLPAAPGTIGIDPSTYELWVPFPDDSEVAEVNLTSGHVDRTIGLGSDAQAAIMDTGNGRVYVSIAGSNSVAVIGAVNGTILDRIEVGTQPGGMALDAANDTLFVANSGSDNVTEIDTATNSVLGAVPVGSSPTAISADDPDGLVFVTNARSGSVSVLAPPTYSVTFSESGLVGQNWSVTLGGDVNSSTGTTIGFSEPDGTYRSSVTGPTGSIANPASGAVPVSEGPASVAIAFRSSTQPTYIVSFLEGGLPAGTTWGVTFNGTAETASAASINLTAPNGSYPFSVSSVAGYTANRTVGTATVDGLNISVQVGFSAASSSTTSSGIPVLWLGVGAAVVLVVVVAAAVLLSRRRPRVPPNQGPPSS